MEMSGLYTAEIKFHSGKSQKVAFRLCIHEPIPEPQILIHSSSNTLDWCNVSLECGTPGTMENFIVTWLSNDFSRELKQQGTLSVASNSRNLSLSLPLSQLNGHLICMVSNPADEKNATLDLESVCPERGSFQSKWLWKGVLVMVLVVSLGAGVWVWKRKKTETERGGTTLLPAVPASATVSQAPPTADSDDLQMDELDSQDPPYAEISPLRPPKNNLDKETCHAQTPKPTLEVHTVYEKIHKSPDPKGDT
ncbi:uncharacterized protein LOC124977085 isoform X2 [Sciurus carolinensis]|nr:uncharacterized protein LOC124977085 isoform X2 [Sciurus carolinensis]